MNEERDEYRQQQTIALDYLKHLTTLAAGAIVLIPSLLENLFPHPVGKGLLVGALIALVASVLLLTSAALGVLRSIRDAHAGGERNITFTSASFLLGVLSFVCGFVVFTAFAALNLVTK